MVVGCKCVGNEGWVEFFFVGVFVVLDVFSFKVDFVVGSFEVFLFFFCKVK